MPDATQPFTIARRKQKDLRAYGTGIYAKAFYRFWYRRRVERWDAMGQRWGKALEDKRAAAKIASPLRLIRQIHPF